MQQYQRSQYHPETCGDQMRMATPFFDTMVNKENVGNYQQPMMGNDYYKPMMEPGMLGNHQQQ